MDGSTDQSGTRCELSHQSTREKVERDVEHELDVQAKAYREGTAGSPAAVARWLRILADKLEAVDG